MPLFTPLKRVSKVLALALTMATTVQASHEFVQADISGGTVKAITPTIQSVLKGTKAEFKKGRNQNSCYFLDRNSPDTYHVTLDSIVRRDGKRLTAADHDAVVQLIGKFKAESANQKPDGKKSYGGDGFELRLYVHYVDGRIQHYAMKPSKKVKAIQELQVGNTPIAYANLVIKHGTQGKLKKDWEEFRKSCLDANRTYKTKGEFPKLDTHLTIANLYKYTPDAFAKRKAGQKVAYTPFSTPHDKEVLMKAFMAACANYKVLDTINVNRITVRGENGNSQVWLGKRKQK